MIQVLGTAGFWRRGAALGIDAMWLFCVLGTVSWLLAGTPLPVAGVETARMAFVRVLWHFVPAAVLVIGWARYGTTPGKLLLELRVVDARTGERAGWIRALIRCVGYAVSLLPLGLGFVWAAFDRNGQALHDKLAGTRVVRVRETVLPDSRVHA